MRKEIETLSTLEVANDLGIGRATCFRWIKEGKIPAIKLGRNYRIPLEPYLRVKSSLLQFDDPSATPLAVLVDEWLNHLLNGPRPFSPQTVNDYRNCFRRYLKRCGGGSTPLEILDKERVTKVIESIPIAQHANRYHTVYTLVSFAKYLVARKLIGQEVHAELKTLRPRRYFPAKKTVMDAEQINRFINAIWTMQGNTEYERRLNYAIVKTFLLTGLRNQELCSLTLQDIDLNKRVLTVQMGKGAKQRAVGINQELVKILSDYLQIRPYTRSNAFFITDRGTPLLTAGVSRRIKRLADDCGFEVTTHGLRRSFVTQAALQGRSLAVISKAVGHENLTTTQGYLMLSERQVIADMQEW